MNPAWRTWRLTMDWYKTHEEERRPLRPLRMREAGEPPGAWERPGVAEAAMTTAENIKSLPGGDAEETREGLTLLFLNAIADGPGRRTDTGQYPDKPPPGFRGGSPRLRTLARILNSRTDLEKPPFLSRTGPVADSRRCRRLRYGRRIPETRLRGIDGGHVFSARGPMGHGLSARRRYSFRPRKALAGCRRFQA